VVSGVAAEPALVDEPLFGPVERQPHVLEVENRLDRLPAHDLGRVLVHQVVAALHRVVGVPLPVVLLHVPDGGAHAALGGAGVAPGGVELGDDGGRRPAGRFQRSPKTGPAPADYQTVVSMKVEVHPPPGIWEASKVTITRVPTPSRKKTTE
jgi:hypothetical protein